jgi:CO/xanthine dehydrogenase FAD-binding subunit
VIASPGYLRPDRLEAALAELAHAPCTVVAGGTDLYAGFSGTQPRARLLDLSLLPGIRGIDVRADTHEVRIGALTTWSDLVRTPLPRHLRALVQAAGEVGGVQIQNRGTVGGNLCNASPAADGVPPLLALNARVQLSSLRGQRELSVDRFVLGNRRTALAADELLTAIVIPGRSPRSCSTFLKLGHRRYLVISIVMVAAAFDFDAAGRVSACGIGVGACSAAARRLADLERALLGVPRRDMPAAVQALLANDALAGLAPIDDVRATRSYRLDAARTLLERALIELATEPGA